MKRKRGISLITLVVIIVIIIILSGAVGFAFVRNNPIYSATVAKVKSDYDAFSTNLELYKADTLTKDIYTDILSIYTPPYDIEELVPSMKDEKFHGVDYKDIYIVYKGDLVLRTDLEIEKDDNIPDEEKDNVKKKRDEVEKILGLKRRGDEESLISPDMPVITLYYSDGTLLEDNRYTKENITANISTNIITNGYHLEYYESLTKEWIELTNKDSNVTIPNNCYIIARIVNEEGEEIGTTSAYTINVIDKKAPINVTVTKEVANEISFKVNISAEDIEEDGYVISGIKEYEVHTLKDGAEYKVETTKENTYTLNKLDMSSSYEVYVVARDNALNETVSDTIVITTSSTKPTISVNKTAYTNLKKADGTPDPLIATIGMTEVPEGYTMEYSIDNGANYTEIDGNEEQINITKNCIVKARLKKEDSAYVYADDKEITNIDTLVPKQVTLTYITGTTNTLTLKAVAKDADATYDNAKSGIASYEFHIGDKVVLEEVENGEEEKEITAQGLNSGKAYTCYVIVTDVAGNKRQSANVTPETEKAKYTITYYANNGTEENKTETKIQDTNYTVATNTFAKAEYKFTGWNTKSDGTGTAYAAGTKYTGNGALDLYAQWIINVSNLTVNPNGGSITVNSAAITSAKTYKQTCGTTLSYTKPTKTNTSENTTYTVTYNYNGNGQSSTTATATRTVVTKYDGSLTKSATFNGTLSSTTAAGTYTFPSKGGVTDTITAEYTASTASDTTTTVTLPSPSRTGYTFDGWYDGNTKVTSPYTPTGNITLTAHWTQNESTLKVNPNGGSITVNNVAITAETSYTQKSGTTLTYSKPTKANTSENTIYTVTYNYNGNGQNNTTDKATRTVVTKYDGSLTKSATFNGTLSSTTAAGTYTFPSKGGVTDTITAEYAATTASDTTTSVTLPNPTRAGWTFDGWYNGNTKVTSPYTPTGNVTLTAHWTQNESTLKINPNGGSITVNNAAITKETSYTQKSGTTLTYSVPTKKADVSTSEYTVTLNHNYTGSTNGSLKATKTTTVKYTGSLTKSATFNGTLSSTTAAGTYTFPNTKGTTDVITASYEGKTTNTTTEATLTTPTRTGYTFGGWNTKSDGTGTNYSGGSKYTPSGNVTLYAQWTAKTVEVTFMRNTSTTDTTSATQTFTYGVANQSFSAKGWSRDGYTMLGWNENKSATTSQYNTLSGVADSWINTKSPKVTIYAIWEASTWQITYNANGGSGAPSAQEKTSGKDLTLSTTKPTRDGYTFSGWNTAANGSGTPYAAGGKYTTNAAATLYAQWTQNESTLTVNPDGGSMKINGTEITSSTSYTQKSGSTLTYSVPTKATITSNNIYNVKFESNADMLDSIMNPSIAKHIEVVEYTFKELKKSSTFNGKLSSTTAAGTYTFPNTNATTDKITASFNSTKILEETESITLPSPGTKIGYEFLGWYDRLGNRAGDKGESYTPTSSGTLYGKWEKSSSGGTGNIM